jgi:hypothetical protein
VFDICRGVLKSVAWAQEHQRAILFGKRVRCIALHFAGRAQSDHTGRNHGAHQVVTTAECLCLCLCVCVWAKGMDAHTKKTVSSDEVRKHKHWDHTIVFI